MSKVRSNDELRQVINNALHNKWAEQCGQEMDLLSTPLEVPYQDFDMLLNSQQEPTETKQLDKNN